MRRVEIVEIHRPSVTVDRGKTPDTMSNMEIRVDGKLIVSLHYDYTYMDNSRQWTLARALAEQLFPSPSHPKD